MAIPEFHCVAAHEKDLAVGVAGHAFDHLGNIGDQADAAAASGATIIYVSGLGALGYQGLPPEKEFTSQRQAVAAYLARAKKRGIRLAIGYVCATSIVKLNTFDRNWPEELRRRFHSAPGDWRQVDRQGKVLKSWYGGDYEPACMNNPDWRAYEKFMVREQLGTGCDGIFFDNPTVHPEGCYCNHCMRAFERFLERKTSAIRDVREYAVTHPREFMQFRCTIARDFLADMRAYARSVKKDALITANNSLNSADVLFSQCRSYAYNIHEMSKAEDYVVVEDMSSQPRVLANGKILEYGPTYKQLAAISHGKPVVAVTIADADYHTASNLVRLAMAEAAANDASYLSWPTWPEAQRQRMIERIRPQAEFMRKNASLFRDTRPRADVVLFLSFRNWVETADCAASRLAAELTRANIQYQVICEDQMDLLPGGKGKPLSLPAPLSRTKLLLANVQDLNPTERDLVKQFAAKGGILLSPGGLSGGAFLAKVKEAIGTPSISIDGPVTVRAIVRDQSSRTIVHLLNLNIQKVSSFEDNITPARNVQISVRVPGRVRSVTMLSADGPLSQEMPFAGRLEAGQYLLETTLPRLDVAAILVIE